MISKLIQILFILCSTFSLPLADTKHRQEKFLISFKSFFLIKIYEKPNKHLEKIFC